MEASGTSGMKAAANGAINMSVLDGWWDEAYTPEVGWAIGKGEVYDDFNYQDDLESNAIYDLLEKEVIPLFYERGDDGLPRDWIAKMKATMQAICPVFNTSRMVREYAEVAYMPQLRRYTRLAADDFARAKELARWKARLAESWRLVRVVGVTADAPDEIKVGAQIAVRAVVHVGGLQAQDVTVELYHGMLDARGDISEGKRTPMALVEQRGDGDHLYEGAISTSCSGRYGYTVRVLPQHEDMGSPYETGMVTWAQ
jgi:starch phosphorylase